MKNIFAKIILLSLFILLFSCNITKKVPDGAYLLKENKIIKDGEITNKEEFTKFLLQNPNGGLLGFPFWLSIYNLSDDNSLENYNKWLDSSPKIHKFLDKLLSKKQVKKLGESFMVSGKDRLLKKLGEEPIIIDTTKVVKTTNTLKKYLRSIGYFNVEAKFEIRPQKYEKQADVKYILKTGKAYYIDSISHSIESPKLDSLYRKYIRNRKFNKGDKYNLSDFVEERKRLSNLFRNRGFYNFQQSSVTYNISRDTITQNKDTLINIITKIGNYVDNSEGREKKKEYVPHQLGKIKVYTDYNIYDKSYDSISYRDVTFYYKNRLRFKPRVLYNSIALHKNKIYSDTDRLTTLRYLTNMRTFRYPNITYEYPSDSLMVKGNKILDANVYLTPLPKFGFYSNMELTHSNIQALGIGGSLSFMFRNIFKGAETLEFITHGTIGSQKLLVDNSSFFNVFEYGGDLRLTIPRIWFFFKTDKLIPIRMTPQTIFQIGSSIQENIGLDKQKIQSVFSYTWNPKPKDRIVFDLLDVELVKNKNPDNFFYIYNSSYNYLNALAKKYNPSATYLQETGNLDRKNAPLEFISDAFINHFNFTEEEEKKIVNVAERYYRLTENNLILSTSLSYINNNSIKYSEPNFQQYRSKIEFAGFIPSIISPLVNKYEKNGNRTLFGINYAQYLKMEAEYIKHWSMPFHSVLAFRTFAGIAIPYGNSKDIPFTRSYFAGGSNDNRGWRAYSLGPGSGKSPMEFNEANFKFTTNIEYRFKIKNAFKGALFTDAGNIWHVFDNNKIFSDWKLDKLSDIKDIAVSSGFGFRYDLDFFVLRLDFGAKIYNPAKEEGQRLVNLKDGFPNMLLNIGINYPF